MATMGKEWVLRRRPEGEIGPGDLEDVDAPIRDLAEGEVLLRTIYLLLDPTNRIWMSERDQYMPPVRIGDRMRGGNICVVEQSRSDSLAPGDIVSHFGGWGTHSVTPASQCKKLTPIPGVPLTAFQSVLGGTGITAWFGLKDVGQPKPGETVVVTSAAGAVGSIVCQLARLEGCRVIGIAGGTREMPLAAGRTRDRRSDRLSQRGCRRGARPAVPAGHRRRFRERPGGTIMDEIIARMNDHGRVALCGMIATYNDDGPVRGPCDFAPVLTDIACASRASSSPITCTARRRRSRGWPRWSLPASSSGRITSTRSAECAPVARQAVHRRQPRQAAGAGFARAVIGSAP